MRRWPVCCSPVDRWPDTYEPLLPLALAARDAGHVVAFATGAPVTSRARDDGFAALPAGPGADFRAEWAPRFPGWDRLVGDEQRRFFLTEIFAGLELVPRADDLDGVLDEWGPDLVVHEMAELAAPLVCTARGLPYVDVSYGPLIPADLLRAAGGQRPRTGGRGTRAPPRSPGCSATSTSTPARPPCRTPRSHPSRRCSRAPVGRRARADLHRTELVALTGPAADLPHARDGLQPRPRACSPPCWRGCATSRSPSS